MINHEISRSPSRWSKRQVALLLLAIGPLASAGAATADEGGDAHPVLKSQYALTAGVFFPERSFTIGVEGSVGGVERDIDISEQFKLSDDETTQSYEFGWRFGERWVLRGQHFKVGGSRSAVLEEDVQWGDYTFGAGTGVAAGIDIAITRLFVGRTFRTRENQEFGIGGGLHRFSLDTYIAGQAIINDEPPIQTEQRASTRGPLPNLGAWYVYAFNPKWALTSRLDWLSASIDKYDGTIINAAVGVTYAFNEHFLLGANYNYFEVDVEVSDDPWSGFVETQVDGPFAYISFHW